MLLLSLWKLCPFLPHTNSMYIPHLGLNLKMHEYLHLLLLKRTFNVSTETGSISTVTNYEVGRSRTEKRSMVVKHKTIKTIYFHAKWDFKDDWKLHPALMCKSSWENYSRLRSFSKDIFMEVTIARVFLKKNLSLTSVKCKEIFSYHFRLLITYSTANWVMSVHLYKNK